MTEEIKVIDFKKFMDGTWNQATPWTAKDTFFSIGIVGWCTLLVGLTKELVDAGVLP